MCNAPCGRIVQAAADWTSQTTSSLTHNHKTTTSYINHYNSLVLQPVSPSCVWSVCSEVVFLLQTPSMLPAARPPPPSQSWSVPRIPPHWPRPQYWVCLCGKVCASPCFPPAQCEPYSEFLMSRSGSVNGAGHNGVTVTRGWSVRGPPEWYRGNWRQNRSDCFASDKEVRPSSGHVSLPGMSVTCWSSSSVWVCEKCHVSSESRSKQWVGSKKKKKSK